MSEHVRRANHSSVDEKAYRLANHFDRIEELCDEAERPLQHGVRVSEVWESDTQSEYVAYYFPASRGGSRRGLIVSENAWREVIDLPEDVIGDAMSKRLQELQAAHPCLYDLAQVGIRASYRYALSLRPSGEDSMVWRDYSVSSRLRRGMRTLEFDRVDFNGYVPRDMTPKQHMRIAADDLSTVGEDDFDRIAQAVAWFGPK